MNAKKKQRKYSKIERKVKITSIVLILCMLISNIFTVNAQIFYGNDTQKRNDINTSFEVAQTSVTPLATEVAATTTKSISANNEFNVVCSLDNITSFNQKSFKITYSVAQVTLVDLAAQTPVLNVSVGAVADTHLEILSHNTATGVLTFKVNKTVASGKKWSGAVTVLRFKAKTTCNTTIKYEIEHSPYRINAGKGIIIVPPQTTISTLLENGIMSVTKHDGSVYTDTYVGTNANAKLADGRMFTVVVYGDVTGDGRITLQDVMMVSDASVNRPGCELSGAFFEAAKVAGNDGIDIQDVMLIYDVSVNRPGVTFPVLELPIDDLGVSPAAISINGKNGGEPITITVTTNKTSVKVGEEITITVKMSSPHGLGNANNPGMRGISFRLDIPKELNYKSNSFNSIDFRNITGFRQALGAGAGFSWNDTAKTGAFVVIANEVYDEFNDKTDILLYNGKDDLTIATFVCTVNAVSSNPVNVGVKNVKIIDSVNATIIGNVNASVQVMITAK